MSTETLRSQAYWYARGRRDGGHDVICSAFAIAFVDAYMRLGRIPSVTKAFEEFDKNAIITEDSVVC